MPLSCQDTEPRAVTILILEQFAMIAFSSTIEPLREANWVAGKPLYKWTVVSHDGKPVRASNGLMLQVDGAIQDVAFSPIVIVCSSFDPQLHTTPAMLGWLRRQARRGAMVGAVETGAHVLARAGLLDGYRATIHWENAPAFAEEFPEVRLTATLFEIDRRRFTASGASAAMDMMLAMIAEQAGQKVASGIADEFIYNRMRQAQSPQRLPVSDRLRARNPRLRRLLGFFERMLTETVEVADMAASEGISVREVQRLFKTHLGVSPKAYHRRLRLQHAQALLRQTDMAIGDIASNCGFSSGADFSRAYRRAFARRPIDDSGAVYLSS
ncbi:MAG TPA: GlxA family transcriptional regulator [Mesorhizobium sp.]|jgi:transcriptional regulator GlxA family with amidase domain|uniref:GlxA family transcriptional regulator n=1 Tax=Mesorhizobium sp. TaxID=1871066 RepID=UPI002DDD5E19|nr:GlxA family transcriptional regulator [Mesorhizobium sp.]HEV2505464.1 GlxA family transcriptional regulator [Mesorhizobium sp.]